MPTHSPFVEAKQFDTPTDDWDLVVASRPGIAQKQSLMRYLPDEYRATPLKRSAGHTHSKQMSAEERLLARALQAESDLERLAGQLVETQDQLLAMYDLTRATRSHVGMIETLRHLAYEAVRLVRVQAALLCVAPIMMQYPPDSVDQRLMLDLINSAKESGHDLILSTPSPALPPDIEHLCVLPIQIRGDLTAALTLINREGGFTAPDLKLARAIAEQAGAHIEQALLHQENLERVQLQAEMDVARRVQLQLLPQTRPDIPDLEIFAESRPALQVGGDFYDFVTMPDHSLTLLIGDVAGKGISAAMIMGMIRAVSNSAARFMPDATPASIVSRTNNDLYDDLTRLDSFATAFVARYNSQQNRLHYANAGHAPVIFRPAGGQAMLLEADGMPIGVLRKSLSENYTLDFGSGALLVVTTDGFSEARNPTGEMFGYERLLELVDEFADQPAPVIAMGLYNSIDLFSAGQAQEDDQTIIVIKGIS